MPLLISKFATMKYLHKVGENLLFLFAPIYFIVGFGRHSQLQFAYFQSSCPIFLIMALRVVVSLRSDISTSNLNIARTESKFKIFEFLVYQGYDDAEHACIHGRVFT